jgi:hypothetical protein
MTLLRGPGAALLAVLLAGACAERNPLYCQTDAACGPGLVCNQIARQCAPPRAQCTPDGLCAETAPPLALHKVWGTGDASAWIVGDAGTALRWDGSLAGAVPSGVAVSLLGVWGSGPDDVWAVGAAGTVLRWRGAAFAPMQVPSGVAVDLHGVWGSGPDDVWVVGRAGTVLRFRGDTPAVVESATRSDLLGVWGSGRDDVWAVGVSGTVVRWNGTAFAPVSSGVVVPLYGVWGSGPGDVWAVGPPGAVLRITGGKTPVMLGVPAASYMGSPLPLTAVWGGGPDDVWLGGPLGVLAHWDGAGFTAARSGSLGQVLGIWGSGPRGTVLAVGTPGLLLRYLP